MRFANVLLAAVAILAATVPLNCANVINPKKGVTALRSNDAGDAHQAVSESTATEGRSLRVLARFKWVSDAAKAFKKKPMEFLRKFKEYRKWF
ncbi:hypothetical protein GN958_ATG00683 [Phytophthora infestans]|uniref:RxLR effector protein n=1 Tax=Phytophthora infestans TaxID=4787 RepID=A0A8S9VCY0_PHYIN|nr:hypothetical protein GN958_ATG12609 [Phytophthora infestans]KAF4150057.1 hypothetical protein GN958_ATG00683 [Phytophthora infestans]